MGVRLGGNALPHSPTRAAWRCLRQITMMMQLGGWIYLHMFIGVQSAAQALANLCSRARAGYELQPRKRWQV